MQFLQKQSLSTEMLDEFCDYTDTAAPPIAKPLRIVAIIIAAFIAIFALWSLLAPLSKAAIAPGMLQVEGRRRTIQHLEGGINQEILAREGARVRAGQVLMRLDNAQTGPTVTGRAG